MSYQPQAYIPAAQRAGVQQNRSIVVGCGRTMDNHPAQPGSSQYAVFVGREHHNVVDTLLVIEWHHGWVCLPSSTVNRHPDFVAKFVNGRLKWPGPIKRQSDIITNYLQYENYMCQSNGIEFWTLDKEQDLQDAIIVHHESDLFCLPDLASLALREIERLGNEIPLVKVINNLAAFRPWVQNNADWARTYIARRASQKNIITDRNDYHGMSLRPTDPLIDGLVVAINNLRFPSGLIRQ